MNKLSWFFMTSVFIAEIVVISLLISLSKPAEPNGFLLCDSHTLSDNMTCRPYTPTNYGTH